VQPYIGVPKKSMRFHMDDHLPLVSVEIDYNGNIKMFNNVLQINVMKSDYNDLENAITRKMYELTVLKSA
jgi:hypothetical protein